jgi:hypothetical protein
MIRVLKTFVIDICCRAHSYGHVHDVDKSCRCVRRANGLPHRCFSGKDGAGAFATNLECGSSESALYRTIARVDQLKEPTVLDKAAHVLDCAVCIRVMHAVKYVQEYTLREHGQWRCI